MAETASARKVQLTIPPADTTTNQWLDAQYSAADSIRKLIRESVAREGFTDVANRPVRPPAHPIYVAEDFPDEPAAPSVRERSSTHDEPAPRPKPVDKPEPAPVADEEDRSADEEDVPETPHAAEPPRVSSPKPTVVGGAAPVPGRTAADTIDDILGL